MIDLDADLAIELAPSVVQRLGKWQEESGYRLTFDRWLTAGTLRPSRPVVVARGPGFRSRLIIKGMSPTALTSREPRLHAQALTDAPADFKAAHLVAAALETIEATDKWRVLFQEIAGDSLRTVRPLDTVLHDNELPILAKTIAEPCCPPGIRFSVLSRSHRQASWSGSWAASCSGMGRSPASPGKAS